MSAEAVQPQTNRCLADPIISFIWLPTSRSPSIDHGPISWGMFGVLCSPNFKKPLRIRPWCWNCFVVSFQTFDGYTTTLKRFNYGCNPPILLSSTFLQVKTSDFVGSYPNISNIHTILQHDTAMSRCFSSVYPGNPWRSGAPWRVSRSFWKPWTIASQSSGRPRCRKPTAPTRGWGNR